jgi:hypothetical protein
MTILRLPPSHARNRHGQYPAGPTCSRDTHTDYAPQITGGTDQNTYTHNAIYMHTYSHQPLLNVIVTLGVNQLLSYS